MADERQPAAYTPHLVVEPLTSHHDRATFSCGIAEMDLYLRQTAGQHNKSDVSRPFVLVSSQGSVQITGYYTLSNYALTYAALPAELARGRPSRVLLPATLLGRIAVDARYHHQGLGRSLLYHALREALRASRTSASIGVVVDARTDALIAFYQKRGFIQLLDKPRHLIAPMNHIRAMFPDAASGVPAVEDILREASAIAETLDEMSEAFLSGDAFVVDDNMRTLFVELQRRLAALRQQDGGRSLTT